MAGISRVGAYAPRRRLNRAVIAAAHEWFAPELGVLGRGHRATANWDEDAITMAVEAARDCLGDTDRAEVEKVLLASTSAPFADRQNAGIVKEALALRDNVATLDVAGSQRAGTGALIQALDAARAAEGATLVVASERPHARPASEDELTGGDAAAALLVTAGDGVARFIGSYSLAVDLVDHFRTSGSEFSYGWESRWVREQGMSSLVVDAIKAAMGKFDVRPDLVRHLVLDTNKAAARSVVKSTGINEAALSPDLQAEIGRSGTAHPLLMLARALEHATAGDLIMVVGFGQGVDVLVFEATPAIGAVRRIDTVSRQVDRGIEDSNYLRYLATAGHLRMELGKRADFDHKPILSGLYRERKSVLGLIGGRHRDTGQVQFPRSPIAVSQDRAEPDVLEEYPLAERKATILTYTSDRLAYSPDPPSYYGMVEFEGGGRLFADFTDVQEEEVEVGASMRMVFRIKAVDNRTGFIKYFWKAAPAVGEG